MKKFISILFLMILLSSSVFAKEYSKTQIKLLYGDSKPQYESDYKKEHEFFHKYYIRKNKEAYYLPFIPRKEKGNSFVVICPGGGYDHVAFVKEGTRVAKWLKKQGIPSLVLIYRLPNTNPNLPIEDVKTALGLARKMAPEKKIVLMGFSAAGHLVALTSNILPNGDKPDAAVIYYPSITLVRDKNYVFSRLRYEFLGNNSELFSKYSPELLLSKNTPPTFISCSKDDELAYLNAKLYADKLKENGIYYEFIEYDKGGHSWAWQKDFEYYDEKNQQFLEWLKKIEKGIGE